MIDMAKYHKDQEKLHKLLMTWDRSDLMDCIGYLSKSDLVDLVLDNDLLDTDREVFLKEIEEAEAQ